MSCRFLSTPTSSRRLGRFALNSVLVTAALALFVVPRVTFYAEEAAAEWRLLQQDKYVQATLAEIDRNQRLAERQRESRQLAAQ